MSNVFGADHFAPGQFFTVASLVASQRAYLHVFDAIAPAEVAELYKQKTRHAAFTEVEAKERIAFESGPAAGARGGFGVDSTVWFKAMTQKIDLMKEVENAMADAILGRAGDMQATAAAQLQRTLLLGLGILLAAFAGAWLLAHRIVAPIRRLTQVAYRVSAGDLEQTVPLDAPAELGDLAVSFRHMVDAVKAMRLQGRSMPGRSSGSRVLRS
jgi:methyl-accepting chemotaxis protein